MSKRLMLDRAVEPQSGFADSDVDQPLLFLMTDLVFSFNNSLDQAVPSPPRE